MQIRSAFNAEHKRGFMFQKMLGKVVILARAEEGEPTPDGAPTEPSINFEQMIAQARKEEKDKLYPRIKKAEDEVKVLTASNNNHLLEIAALKDELEKLKSQPEDKKVKELQDTIATLEAKVDTLETENKALKENAPNEEEIRKKVEAEFEVKLYAQEQIAANKDSIISILIPEITGSTKEEIDSAIATAKEKTATIKKDLGIDDGGDKSDKKKDSGNKQKKVPPASPASNEGGSEYDAEYIRNLDPRSKEYAEFRKKLGLK